jgi:translocation and assembly module TamB
MRRVRRLLAGLLLGVPLVALFGALLAVNSGPGRAAIERRLAEAVPGLSVSGLEGPIPGLIRLAGAEMADQDGAWLRLSGIVLQPDWPALLRGEARIALLSAAEVLVLRLPAGPAEPAPAAPLAVPEFSLPQAPLPIILDRLEIGRLRIAEPAAGLPIDLSLHGMGRWSGDRLSVALSAAETGAGARAEAEGQLGPEGLRLGLVFTEPADGRIPSLLGLSPGETRIAATLEGPPAGMALSAGARIGAGAEGRLSGRIGLPAQGGLQASLDAVVTAAPLPGLPLPITAALVAELPPEGPLRLSRLGLSVPGAEAEAAGEIDLDAGEAALRFRLMAAASAPFAALLPEALAWAGLGAEGTLDGPLRDPALQLTLRLARAEAGGVAAEQATLSADLRTPLSAPHGSARLGAMLAGRPVTVEAAAALDGGRLRVDRLDARHAGAEATARLTLYPEARRAEGEATIRMPDLSPLGALAGAELAGAAEIRIALTPAAEGAQGLAVNARLDEGRIAGSPASGRFEASAVLRPERLAGEAALRLDAEAAGLALAVEAAAELDDGALRIGLSRLEARHPSASLRLAAPGSILRAADGALTIPDLRFTAPGGGSLAVAGRFGPEDTDLTARLAALPVALLGAASAPGLGLRGTLSGEARLSGPAAAPDLAVTLSGSGLGAEALAGLPPGSVRITARLPGLARLEGDVAADLGNAGRITGRVSLPDGFGQGDALSLRLAGQGDVARLAGPFLAGGADRVSGRLDIDMAAGGRIGRPTLSGRARLGGGQWSNAALGARLTDIVADIRGGGEAILIERLTAATTGGGRLSARGRIGLSDGLPLDVSLQARGARPVQSDLVSGTFDADLRMTGAALGQSQISGSMLLRRLEIEIPERLPRNLRVIPDIEERGRGRAAARTSPAAAPPEIGLAVTLDAPRAVFLRGQGVDAELGGRIEIGGTMASPQLVGGFSMRRGTLTLLDRRLAFSRGELGFDGSLTPTLDLVATSRVRDLSLSASVTGPATEPRIGFSSVPELPQDEILARLLFDRPMSELSPFQLAQLGAAVAGAVGITGGGGGGLLDRLRRALALDRLAIGSAPAEDGDTETTLEGGRYVADRVFVGVTQGAQGGPPRVGVRIDLLPRLRFEGSTGGAQGDGRVGLTFEVEY